MVKMIKNDIVSPTWTAFLNKSFVGLWQNQYWNCVNRVYVYVSSPCSLSYGQTWNAFSIAFLCQVPLRGFFWASENRIEAMELCCQGRPSQLCFSLQSRHHLRSPLFASDIQNVLLEISIIFYWDYGGSILISSSFLPDCYVDGGGMTISLWIRAIRGWFWCQSQLTSSGGRTRRFAAGCWSSPSFTWGSFRSRAWTVTWMVVPFDHEKNWRFHWLINGKRSGWNWGCYRSDHGVTMKNWSLTSHHQVKIVGGIYCPWMMVWYIK